MLSSSTPAFSSPRLAVLGPRPVAIRIWSNDLVDSPSGPEYVSSNEPSSSFLMLFGLHPVFMMSPFLALSSMIVVRTCTQRLALLERVMSGDDVAPHGIRWASTYGQQPGVPPSPHGHDSSKMTALSSSAPNKTLQFSLRALAYRRTAEYCSKRAQLLAIGGVFIRYLGTATLLSELQC